jgi:molybdopterin converting factor subunit 1
MPKLTIRYFARLREERGREEETVETGAANPADLFEDLRARHGFTMERKRLWVAVNDAAAPWDTALHDGDTVVFIPPVAGG